MADLPGKELARELIEKSQDESRATPIEEVIQAIGNGGSDGDSADRLIGRLWTLERMFYHIYGGWGQGLEMNDFPPSVKYLFSKQIVDESTHEMIYLDALLKRGFAPTQKDVFRHPYGAFVLDSALAYYVFSLRNLATYPHPIRIAALNMGRRIVEEFVHKPVEADLCRWACAVAKRDYGRFLGELSAFVLGREAPAPPAPRRQVTD